MNKKELAGVEAANYVKDGMKVGLGTGSTVYYTIVELGRRVAAGLRIVGIPTSAATEALAKELHIPLTTFQACPRLDLTIDGADAVTPDFQLIKGGGGALLREKLVAAASDQLLIVVDDGKLYDSFANLSIPIEVVPFAWETTAQRIANLGGKWTLREREGVPFVTDNHNYILDTVFDSVADPGRLQDVLKAITGVVETGLFINMADAVIVGRADSVETLSRADSP
ncbi:ribose 5-phosphate isomerase [Alicyclobacillus hesperidum URH17-3-68]|uniref:Ribose-5-phosphate isomerase A n=1 Tax=Alicyclobacillus hesperidum TaxID=89784 RepID=A0A1H2TCX0_9BACL|nr:ribose-5-phosphate isomerase RpiA [Alicyclobacillus hesperidum]EJY56016.1 ribose 5-phosphate isomerase [Alicyclobacillus hesperidum URH17-3-68]GLV13853.1 ribose-5-phosphate isomerase A [Alicyclobacillus hesperidum]SDW41732.1 ribose-5-phosphate isomerase [Alicyclobacillus hesperidum]